MIPLPYNTILRDHSVFDKISDIGHSGKGMEVHKDRICQNGVQNDYRASDATLHQVISTAMLLTVQTMILTTKKVQLSRKK